MKELKNIFQPEVSPIHKVEFSVASQLMLEGADATKELIPAGTLLKSATAGSRIELAPEAGVKIAKVADAGEALGVLMHDVAPAGAEQVSVGVMIKGVVYEDVMVYANEAANFTAAVKTALLPNITTYKVNTMKN